MNLVLLAVLASVQLESVELENGLDVITMVDHSSPIVTVCVTVNTGAACESPETNGLAHFYEHMFFKGNAALPDQTAYNARMRELGIIRNGTTGTEVVRYYLTLPSESFREGMVFMYDAIATPLFLQEEIVRERSVIMNEYQRNAAGPWWNLQRASEEVLTIDPWRSSAIGVPEVIEAAGRETMLEFQRTYYTPDNSALIITGDVNRSEMLSAAEDIFSRWEYGGRSNYFQLEGNLRLDRDTLVSVAGPSDTGMIRIVYRGPSMADQQEWTYAADVWGQYMDRMTGEFHTSLVTNGPFQSVSASYYSQRFEPEITFSGFIEPGMLEQGLILLEGEIDRMFQEDYFSSEGIDLAVEQLRRHRLFQQESARDMAIETLPFWWVQGGGLDYYLDYPENLAAVEKSHVQSFLSYWVEDSPRAVFLVSPEGEWRE